MLIDKSKMAVVICFSFLNRRNQLTNLKLRFLLKTANKTNLYEQNRSTKTSHDRPIQIVPPLRLPNSDRTLYTIAINQFRAHNKRFVFSFVFRQILQNFRLYLTTVFFLVPWQALQNFKL